MSEKYPQKFNKRHALIIFLIGGLVYFNSIHNGFIFDDWTYIVHNPSIRHLWDLQAIYNTNPRRFLGTWTFALNYVLGGLDVRAYHLTNILIHLICAILVWHIGMLIFSIPRFQHSLWNLERRQLAFWAALIFIVHPLQTSAVDQITQRYVLLGALFYLLAVFLYLKARVDNGRNSGVFFVLAFLSGVLGILSRESDFTLPLALIICETLILKDSSENKNKTFLLGLTLCGFILVPLIVLEFYRYNSTGIFNAHLWSQSHQGDIVTAYNYFLTQSQVMMIYLRLLFWPVPLNFDYDIKLSQHFFDPSVLVGFLVIGSLCFLAWRLKNKYPLLSWGIFWFFITQVLETSFFPIFYVIAEYRLYLPIVGFCFVFVFLTRSWITNQRIFTMVMGMVILIFAILTVQRNLVYHDAISLWSDTVLKSPKKPRVYTNLAQGYLQKRQFDKALDNLHQALILDPNDMFSLITLTQVYTLSGQIGKAIDLDLRLLKIFPSVTIYNNLGIAYKTLGQWDKAELSFLNALKAKNSSRYATDVKLNLAEVYAHQGHLQDAINICKQVIAQDPKNLDGQSFLVQLYLTTNQYPQSFYVAKDILDSTDVDPNTLFIVGHAFAAKGYGDIAANFYAKAKEFKP